MASYGEFILPPVDDRPVGEIPADTPSGIVCGQCGHANCPTPGACS
jgi:hypothetical protein